jgi:terminase large subunit-like protein
VKTQPTILEAIKDERLLGRGFKKKWLKGDTWHAWRSFLSAVFALPFEDDGALEIYRKCSGRVDPPSAQFREAYLICGRRSGKSYLTAACATYIAAFRDYSQFLSPGEVGIVAIVAADKSQAAIILRYIKGFFQASAVLRSMVVSDLKETIALNNGIEIQILTADFRSVRGRTLCAALVDELAFLNAGDESANPDSAVLEALRPGLISIPDSILIGLSSPYAKRGELYRQFKENFGVNDSPVLIWKAASSLMNPSLSSLAIASAYLRDPVASASEFGGEFRSDLEGYLTEELIGGCVIRGRTSLPRLEGVDYVAFVDPSGGRNDSMTLGIAHQENEKAVLDVLLERAAPFSPEAITDEFVGMLKKFGISEVTGDKYGAEWCAEQFTKRGITYRPSERNRSQIYLEFLPSVTSGQVELLDNSKMVNQFVGLERRTGRGQDLIDHGPGGHDDLSNSCAGCLVLALEGAGGFAVLEMHSSGRFARMYDGILAATQHVTDIFGKHIENPRLQNVDKAKLYPMEAAMRGLDPATLNPATPGAWQQRKQPPCPVCKSTCTILVGGGATHCNSCAYQWFPGGAPEYLVNGRSGPTMRRQ